LETEEEEGNSQGQVNQSNVTGGSFLSFRKNKFFDLEN